MTLIQKYLKHAFDLLSCISVSGDDVERMAEVKATLRGAYQEEEKSNNNEEEPKTAPQ